MMCIRMIRFLVFISFFINISLCPSLKSGQNLPLPRFVSLRSEKVNVRVGPGSEYPVEWIFTYEKMPVEIVREFGVWRRIRNFEGVEGWVHQSMLSGTRTVMMTTDDVLLKKKPDPDAQSLAHLKQGVVAKLIDCQKAWCRLQIQGYKGWVLRAHVWGVYPQEGAS